MGWFTKKISDPQEAFDRYVSPDKKNSTEAFQELKENFDHSLVQFLCNKFRSENSSDIRLKILAILAAGRGLFSPESLSEVLTLLPLCEAVHRESFKDILLDIDEERLRPLTNVLCSTNDPNIRNIIQFSIERSGIIDLILRKWDEYSNKEKILYLVDLVTLQNPRMYPIFLQILKEEVTESKKDEKKVIQVEFCKHIEMIKDPAFMEICIKELANFDSGLWYPVFKCLQFQGTTFFKELFDAMENKSEQFRFKIMQVVEMLSDPLSYTFLFPLLLKKGKTIHPVAQNTIHNIVRRFSDELELLGKAGSPPPDLEDRISYFIKPLEECLRDEYALVNNILCECILRIGRFRQEIILRNFPKLYKYNEFYLNSFIKGLEVQERKVLLINACCYPQVETGKVALILLGNPTENYIIETLNTLLLEHFLKVPSVIQNEIINLMMDPRLKRFIEEVLYHNDPQLRARIIEILGRSGTQSVLPILASKTRDPDTSVRLMVINLLSLDHFKNSTGTEALMEFLKDTDPQVILKTIELLKERDHPKIIGNLSKLLTGKEGGIKNVAHAAISFVTRKKFLNGFDNMTPETKMALGTSLIKLDPKFLEDITNDLSASDQRVRVLAARVLELLCDYIPPELKTNLIVAIQDPDPMVRAVVIMGLGKIGGPSVATMLISFLKDQDDRVRANAVEALSKVGDLTCVEVLLPCLYDKNNRVRANTIMTLWRLGYYQVFEAVVNMLKEQDKWMRASAAFALGELRDSRFFAVLVQFLRDPDPDVRCNIVKALGKLADPVTLFPYIRPLRFDADAKVRKAVSDILGSATPKASAP